MKNFFILSCARSGTTLLTESLNTHSEIDCYKEEFNPSALRKTNFKEKFNKIYKDTNKVTGCKIFYDHLTENQWRFIQNQNLKVIHLIRNNCLRTFTSLKICESGNAWVNETGKIKPIEKRRIKIDLKEYLKYKHELYKNINWGYNYFKTDYIEIYYEDLVKNFDATMLQIQDFLGVNYQKLQPTIFKQNPEKLEDLIINYDAIIHYGE